MQVKDIANISSEWKLTNDERIDLYLKCAAALDQEGDSTGAFKVYYKAFELIDL